MNGGRATAPLVGGCLSLIRESVGTPSLRGSSAGKKLSKREEDVLRCVAWGLLNREIAARLQISVKTIETHKANAMSAPMRAPGKVTTSKAQTVKDAIALLC